jgi:hypothetical protein
MSLPWSLPVVLGKVACSVECGWRAVCITALRGKGRWMFKPNVYVIRETGEVVCSDREEPSKGVV